MASSPRPCVVRDARFWCGRKLMELGGFEHLNQAVEVFAILLEQTRLTFGDSDTETVPAYYEYGNALLRQHQNNEFDTDNAPQQQNQTAAKDDRRREAAAAAAERRIQALLAKNKTNNEGSNEDDDEKKMPAAVKDGAAGKKDEEETNNNDTNNDDLKLALEMMETSWSILDESLDSDSNNNNNNNKYSLWLKDQAPRILTGLGDALSALKRHPDAVDAYLRALEYRQANVDKYKDLNVDPTSHGNNNNVDPELLLDALNCRRLLVECCVLIAQEILDCPSNQDIVTTETKAVLVKSRDRIEYARGYYDKAREELQETTLLMANIVALTGVDNVKAKQDVCFVATLVMGVGVALEMIEEQEQQHEQKPSATKKLKTK